MLRFHTTFHLHHKALRISWYKTWHDFRFSHHVHATALGAVVLTTIFSLLASLAIPNPNSLLAAEGSWSQTTFNGTSDGTYTNVIPVNANGDLAVTGYPLGVPIFSNAGGQTWTKYEPITVTNFQANFQTKVTVAYRASMKTDFSDIRFYDSTNGTEIPYWIERYTSSTSATVWIKTGANNSIYMYYGNSAATSSSNGGNTFEFFEDFNTGVFDSSKWNYYVRTVGNAPVITNGRLYLDGVDIISKDYQLSDGVVEYAGSPNTGSILSVAAIARSGINNFDGTYSP